MACVAATKTKRWKESGSDDNADDNAGDSSADEAHDYDDADGKCDGDHDEDAVSKGYALKVFLPLSAMIGQCL